MHIVILLSEDVFNYGYILFSINSESHINRSESVQLFESVQRGQRVCSKVGGCAASFESVQRG